LRWGALLLALAATAYADGKRYESADIAFEMPAGWRAESASDPSAPVAVRLVPPVTEKSVQSATVLLGTKRIAEVDLDAEAAGWHAARLKNRVAWGMHSDGGMPRDVLHGARGQKLVRYRDRVGSALGADEQSFTCGLVAARMACVVVFAGKDARDQADALASSLLAQLAIRKR
jgi:hypothetical protein